MKRRIGIYSGTFDPIHPGHVAFAQQTIQNCQLDEVVFLPEQKPRGKGAVTDIVHRVALIERATAAAPNLRVVRLASEQFTVQQTLPELQQLLGDSELTLLLGSDLARTLPYRWEGLDLLLRSVSLAIGLRSADSPDEIIALMEQLAHDYGTPPSYTLIRAPMPHMASSQIRSSTAQMPHLHPDVARYIKKHQLYT